MLQFAAEMSTVLLNSPQADDKQKAQLAEDFIAAFEAAAFDPENLAKARTVVSACSHKE